MELSASVKCVDVADDEVAVKSALLHAGAAHGELSIGRDPGAGAREGLVF